MGSVFGSCGDLFVTWEEGLFDASGNSIVRFTSADGESTLDLCLDPLKGITVNGVPVEVVDGVVNLEFADDLFGSAVVTADTATITFPGQEPFDVCLNPVKTVNGVVPDASGNVELPSSTTVPNADGTVHTITTDDGVPTDVCTDPIKTLVDNEDGTWTATSQGGLVTLIETGTVVDNGDGSGTVTLPDGSTCDFVKAPLPPALSSTVVDNGDGTATITQTDGTTKDVLCAGTVSSVADNGDGTATITQNDGTVKADAVCGVQSNVVDNGDGSATMLQNDGSTCDVVKAPLPPAAASTVVDNGDGSGTVTQTDGTSKSFVCSPLNQAAVVDNGDGTGSVTDSNGNVCTFLKQVDIPADVRVTGITFEESADGSQHNIILQLSDGSVLNAGPVVDAAATVVDNGDGTGTVTDAAGNACVFAKGPIVIPPGTVSSLVDNGDGTWTHTSGAGTVTVIETGSVVDNGDGTSTITFPDGSTGTYCNDPVKDVVTADGTSVVVNGVATLPASAAPVVSSIVDNADNTFTHSDGAGNDVIIGTGSVTDNGDGTVALADSEGNTCNAPAQKLVDWVGADFAKDAVVKQREYNDLTQYGEFIKFIDSGDGCIPAAPTECPDIPRYTVDPFGRALCWDGVAWTPVGATPGTMADSALINIGSDTLQNWLGDPVAIGDSVATSQTSFSLDPDMLEVVNDCCDELCILVSGRTKHNMQVRNTFQYEVFTSSNLLVDGVSVGTLDQMDDGDKGGLRFHNDWHGAYKVVVPPKSTVMLGIDSLGAYYTDQPEGGISPNFMVSLLKSISYVGGHAK